MANSSPMSPRRSSQVRNVYFSLVVWVFLLLAHAWFSACAVIARLNWIYALILPAWSVPLNSLNSILFEFLNKIDYSLY